MVHQAYYETRFSFEFLRRGSRKKPACSGIVGLEELDGNLIPSLRDVPNPFPRNTPRVRIPCDPTASCSLPRAHPQEIGKSPSPNLFPKKATKKKVTIRQQPIRERHQQTGKILMLIRETLN